MRTASGTLAAGFAASLAEACSQPGERAIEVGTGLDEHAPAPRDAADDEMLRDPDPAGIIPRPGGPAAD